MTTRPSPPMFNPDLYSKVSLIDLVIYSIYSLSKTGDEFNSEDIISACFVFFPKRFSLRKFPQWPDAGIVTRRWSDCKSKGYLRGNATRGFELTVKGIKHAEKVEKLLGRVGRSAPSAPTPKTRKPAALVQIPHPQAKARAQKYIHSIQASDAYKKYGKRMTLNEFDFRSLLLCTMETPPATLARNLGQFKDYVSMYERKDLLTFLEFCEGKFSQLLGNPPRQSGRQVRRLKK